MLEKLLVLKSDTERGLERFCTINGKQSEVIVFFSFFDVKFCLLINVGGNCSAGFEPVKTLSSIQRDCAKQKVFFFNHRNNSRSQTNTLVFQVKVWSVWFLLQLSTQPRGLLKYLIFPCNFDHDDDGNDDDDDDDDDDGGRSMQQLRQKAG